LIEDDDANCDARARLDGRVSAARAGAAVERPAPAADATRSGVRRSIISKDYEGDSAARAQRAARRAQSRLPQGARRIDVHGRRDAVRRDHRVREQLQEERSLDARGAPREVVVGEVNDQTATAKVVAWWGIDYLQLAKFNGKWMIVNVIWQSPPPK
jgi:hypothetical protein